MTAAPRPRRRRHARPKRLNRRVMAAACALVAACALPTGTPSNTGATAVSDHPATSLTPVGQTLDAVHLHAAARPAVIYSLRRRETAGTRAARAAHRTQHRRTPAVKPPPGQPVITARHAAVAATASARAAAVVAFAAAQLGKSYVLGGTGPGAFDCSGLVQAAYASVGITLPRVSEAQSAAGTPVSLGALRPGDVLYWGPAGAAYHVALYAGAGEFIGAQNPLTGIIEHALDFDPPSGAVRIL